MEEHEGEIDEYNSLVFPVLAGEQGPFNGDPLPGETLREGGIIFSPTEHFRSRRKRLLHFGFV